MKRIVFVCTGNTCRSPMAMAIFNSYSSLQRNDFKYEAISAGLSVLRDDPPSTNAVLALKDFPGADINNHRAHMLSRSEVKDAFLVLTMTESHKQHILSMSPEAYQKIYTLKEYAYNMTSSPDIADPYGGSLLSYKLCAREIAQAVEKLIEKLI